MWNRLQALWHLLRGQRLRYLAAIAVLFLAIAFGYLVPLVGKFTIDLLTESSGGAAARVSPLVRRIIDALGGPQAVRDNLWIPALAIIALTVLHCFFIYLRGRWAAMAAEGIARKLRDRLYEHLQRLPVAYYDKANTGDLVQRCTSDVETIRSFLAGQVVEIGRAVAMLLLVIPIMLWLNAQLMIYSLLLVPLITIYSVFFFAKASNAFKLQDEAEGDMTGRLQENLTGIRIVRAFARQDYENRKFAEKNALYRDRSYRLVRLMGLFYPSSDFLCLTQFGIALFAAGHFLLHGKISVGDFYLFTFLTGNLLWPVRQMGRTLVEVGKAFVSVDRLQEILREPEELPVGPQSAAAPAPALAAWNAPPAEPATVSGSAAEAVTPAEAAAVDGSTAELLAAAAADASTAAAGAADTAAALRPGGAGAEIVFAGVCFSHAERAILRDVSFRVAPGQTLAILGPSGSGKSTLVNLLLRFYDLTSGAITVNGQDIMQLRRRQVRAGIGVVMQEPFLYSRTLRDNIKLGRSSANDQEIEEAAGVAVVHNAILDFEDGYGAMVGERGVTLSGGQRQRVALARAVLKAPPILILDDALSAVDTRTESLILEALRRRRGRQTTIVIAHRLSTLMQADRIIVLDHGRVVQSGTHSELAGQEGLYRRLWQIQSSLEEDLRGLQQS